MREHGALRLAGRARRVEDRRGVVERRPRRRRGPARVGAEQLGQSPGSSASPSPVGMHVRDPFAPAAATRTANSGSWMSTRAPESVEHMEDLGRREARVDRHEDRAELRRSEQHLEELGAVLAQVRDAVALADAALPQQRRDPVGRVGELAIRDHVPVEDEGGLVGRS